MTLVSNFMVHVAQIW